MKPYEYLLSTLQEITKLSNISSLLSWDQEVNMPPQGAGSRGEQIELLQRLMHRKLVDDRLFDSLRELTQNITQYSEDEQVNIRETLRTVERKRAVPESFVAEDGRVRVQAYAQWIVAKKESKFSLVEGSLKRIFELRREEASLLRQGEESPYTTLLDDYERGMTEDELEKLFAEVQPGINAILNQNRTPLQPPLPLDKGIQQRVGARIMTLLGFESTHGRLDEAPHPFCAGVGLGDIRVTTRYSEEDGLSSVLTLLHELGHALYEQGLPAEFYGTPRGEASSLGVHESQSRFWENYVGRTLPFSSLLERVIQEAGGPKLSSEAIWSQLSAVHPTLIRVEADQVTYPLHIVIRTTLERELINNVLQVTDLPERWNSLYREYLGISPQNDAEGVLQDVHWFHGAVGYFPTYLIGEIYAAHLWQWCLAEFPDINEKIRSGDLLPILALLKKAVHTHGQRYLPKALIERAIRGPVSTQAYLSILKEKYFL